MGWAEGGDVFDPVARKLIEDGASDDLKREVCDVLIAALQGRGWDTEEESLGEFDDDEAIVEAFRRNGITIECGAEGVVQDVQTWCVKERGHPEGGTVHSDLSGREWN